MDSIDLYQLKKIGLESNLSERLPNIAAMTLGMSTLAAEVDQGFFIAKQNFKIHKDIIKNSNIHTQSKILNKKKTDNTEYIICQSNVLQDETLLSELTTHLIKNKNNVTQIQKKLVNLTNPEGVTKKITKQNVYDFCRWSKDPNEIHLTNEPVVPGMLLLLIMEDILTTYSIKIKAGEIKYHHPVIADTTIYFNLENKKKIIGYVNNSACFTLKITEVFTNEQ